MSELLPVSKHPLSANPKYGKAVESLKEKHYRECNRDGNCLYSSVTLLIFPLLRDERAKSMFYGFTKEFEEMDVPSVVYECYITSIEEIIEKISVDDLDSEDLTVFTAYLRLICSTHAKMNEKKYQSFIQMDLKQYCAEHIDPMDQRAGSFELAVLADALQLKITVISIADDEKFQTSFGEGPEVKILHTPDHFEPLYD
ncbi:uncharacterized protein VICG_00629 [Vittaforma corneae ATCC 50505]|uniref:ubiquitinyl hydrolase 1 n=1 Tax=Vittaforma corneae (strain ATCC 50505) TaxID=993615 RepID=L2GP02_VITCO|nr:uncharacterized protein VICG_00629 [Vittaforma corneae ATCC 50505]ELA42230.1 hypothetical protein VICG_00629 [Vittaforma corneae ATCC 50505]